MTTKQPKENKTSNMPLVRVTPTEKAYYDNALSLLNFKYGDIVRKTLDNLVNNLDKLLNSNIDDYDNFIDQTIDYDDLINAQKDMLIDLPDFTPLDALFNRRSDSKQSIGTERDQINAIRENGEVDSTILSFDDNSSYKDLAFLKALQYTKINNLPLRIFARSRSELETVTRSADNMKIYVRYAQENVMFDVTINGFNLFYDGSLLIFLADINESKWLSNANTKLAEKHFRYKKALESKDLSKLEELEKKEVISLLKYNRGIDKVIKFFEYLENKYINNKKRTIKRLNEGNLSKSEKKSKLTIDELIKKNTDKLNEMIERIELSRK